MATRIEPEAQEAIATARFIRMSATKARQVVDLIRGRHVEDARRVLAFTPRGASPTVTKVLNSAIANAEHNRGLSADELVVTRAWVDEGPTLKRFRPRALGRATRINKRTCHISVAVGRPAEAVEELATVVGDESPSRRTRRTEGEEPSTADSPAPKKTTAKKTTAKSKTTAPKKTTRRTTTKTEGKEE